MKKNTFLFLAAGLLLSVGMISCSSSSKNTPPPPIPKASLLIAGSGRLWQISSVKLKKTDRVTDSVVITSSDTLSNSRIGFSLAGYNGYNINLFGASDKSNPTWGAPKNDTTLFRYGTGQWIFDQNWYTSTNAGNLTAVPDSFVFVTASFNNAAISNPTIFRAKFNQFDSLNMIFTYLDSSILNKTTNTKYQIMKVVSLVPATN